MDYNTIILVIILNIFLLAGISLILFAQRIESSSTKFYLLVRGKIAKKLRVEEEYLAIYWRNPFPAHIGVWFPRIIGIFFAATSIYLLLRLI